MHQLVMCTQGVFCLVLPAAVASQGKAFVRVAPGDYTTAAQYWLSLLQAKGAEGFITLI